MKKVFLIGDCHSARALEHHDPSKLSFKYKIWGRAGESAWHCDPIVRSEENMMSTGTEVGSQIIKQDLAMPWNEIEDGGLIQIWLGYTDIRQMLPKWQDADLVVKQMVERFVSFYPNSKIQFIEPLPQFTEMMLKYPGISHEYTYEQRLKQNNDFCAALHKYVSEYNLEKIITQDDIQKSVGYLPFTPENTPQDRPYPVDCLDQKYMKHIYDLFAREAGVILDSSK